MTPFGARVRELRQARGATLSEMAEAIGVSAAYLSALEHGRRPRPTAARLDQICAYFQIIWDDAEELKELARRSRPRVVIDCGGLSPDAVRLGNALARQIGDLDPETLQAMLALLEDAEKD